MISITPLYHSFSHVDLTPNIALSFTKQMVEVIELNPLATDVLLTPRCFKAIDFIHEHRIMHLVSATLLPRMKV